MREPPRLCLSSLWDSRAAKAQGKNFCFHRASSASQKFILAPHMSLQRIKHGGAAAPPNLPEFSVFQTISVAQLFVIMTSVVNAMGCCRLNCNSPCLILSFSPTTTLIPEAPGRRYQGGLGEQHPESHCGRIHHLRFRYGIRGGYLGRGDRRPAEGTRSEAPPCRRHPLSRIRRDLGGRLAAVLPPAAQSGGIYEGTGTGVFPGSVSETERMDGQPQREGDRCLQRPAWRDAQYDPVCQAV